MFSLQRLLQEPEWHAALSTEFEKPYWLELEAFLAEAYASDLVYPPAEQIFHALSLTPLSAVNAVIMGQDPYHGGQAHGLSFSVLEPKFPPSLKNIYKAIKRQTGQCTHNQGNLTGWAEQGVLMLNAVLTVTRGKAGSHQKKGWELFTDRIIDVLNQRDQATAFLLWGNYAKQKGGFIDRDRHLVLESVHPSPFSASQGFFDNQHFVEVNTFLASKHRRCITF